LSLDLLTKAYRGAMAEQLLVEYKIALPQYVAQAETVGLIITSLYTDVPTLGTTPGEFFVLILMLKLL